jgi:predicted nucleotidyltransferase
MSSERGNTAATCRTRVGRVPTVSRATIQRWAREIARRFDPERIILFGSHAYGRPHAESDVDVLVVMPAANEISASIRLTLALEPPFPLDLIVRTPEHLRRGLADGDGFLREVVTKGKLLYAQADRALGPQGRSRRGGRRRVGSDPAAA